jgi:hypothetical protein
MKKCRKKRCDPDGMSGKDVGWYIVRSGDLDSGVVDGDGVIRWSGDGKATELGL